MKDIKIVVATHKKYEMPKADIYYPVHVGAEGKTDKEGKPLDFGYAKDNSGDNISKLNYCFGSQTGLYWAWKNLDADYLGLVHYRRYFVEKKVNRDNRLDSILSREKLEQLLEQYKVIVPKKRNYYISTIYDQYANTMNGGKEELDLAREIIRELTPEYLRAFNIYMHRKSGFIFNMMIMPRDLMNHYCEWLFTILLELHNRVDQTGMSDFDKRFCGRISERLFNVWLIHGLETGFLSETDIKELPYTEDVNLGKKIGSFISAKFFKRKYGASF